MKDIALFRIAGLTMSAKVTENVRFSRIIPSFKDFLVKENAKDLVHNVDISVNITDMPMLIPTCDEVLAESGTDIGNVILRKADDGLYWVEVSMKDNSPSHTMSITPDFSRAEIALDMGDNLVHVACTSLLRILFSQAIVLHGGISLHASSVAYEGRAYAFLGESGTGKSTHSSLWTGTFSGCELINDDNPFIRITDQGVMLYGTPWSGKTPCWRNVALPLGGIGRIRRSEDNRFVPLEDVGAFVSILPSCSVIRSENAMFGLLCDTLSTVAENVAIGDIFCRPDEEAARASLAGFKEIKNTQV